MSAPLLPYGRHLIEDDDIAAVAAALRSDWLTTGPNVEAFESALADKVGANHGVVCSSGTAALHLAALALGLGPSDTVIVPTVTFLASATGVHHTGAEIAFADVDPRSGLLTTDTFEAALGRCGGKARVVVAVHLNGQCCDMPALAALARSHSLVVVEDACHALGSRYVAVAGNSSVAVGSCHDSDLACFSFHPVKTIAMGEGGAITTNDRKLAAAMRRLRNHGIVRDSDAFESRTLAFGSDGSHPWYYEMPQPGFNYRASDVHCALGLSQLRKLDRFAARRRALTELYDAHFADWPDWARPVPHVANCDPVLHLYPLLIDFARSKAGSRDAVMRALAERGIGTQVHYLPVHLQPYFARRYGPLDLPGAWAYYERCLSIPLFPAMTDDDVARVVASLFQVLIE